MDDARRQRPGISRRTVLRRGAVAGALVWSAPVIRSVPALAADATSPMGDGKDISFLALVIECDGTGYRVRYEAGVGFEDAPGAGNTGCYPDGYRDDTLTAINGADLGITVDEVTSSRFVLCIPADGGCTLTSARAKAGSKNQDDFVCEEPVSVTTGPDGTCFTFQL